MALAPFTVLIDSMEQQPWSFIGIRGDVADDYQPWSVRTSWKALGIRSGDSYEPRGDYSLDGYEGRVHLERKSVADLQATVLGWDGRRDRFKRELEILAGIEFSAVIVEGTLGQCLSTCQQWGKKSAEDNRKILNRSLIAFMQDYRVPWIFADSRRLAEVEAFRWFQRAYRKMTETDRKQAKAARTKEKQA
jgi:hypothetical protein